MMFVITTVCNNHLSIVDLKQIDSYFLSSDGFIQDQQRIATWGLQPWQVQISCSKEKRTLLQRGKGKAAAIVSRESTPGIEKSKQSGF